MLQLLSVSRSERSIDHDSVESGQEYKPLDAFFSIHVATHNEPPEVVCGTLDALAQMRYTHFEVIVIDNNTADPLLWEPVYRHCIALGSKFSFLHQMDVKGAKAGALNIARQQVDLRANFIVTVDADYRVSESFLLEARSALQGRRVDYIQFPQAYRIQNLSQRSLANELGDYFSRHAQGTNGDESMLLTGTLSVISIDALDKVGGWPTQTVTEDAELGIKLQREGFKGSFVNLKLGCGLLPPSAHELRKQRHRWVVGNVQVMTDAILDSRHRISLSHMVQLSAWCAFIAIPYLLLAFLPVLSLASSTSPVMWYPAMSVVLVSILAQMTSYLALSRTRPGFFGVKWAMALPSSWASLSALAGSDVKFRCTRRTAARHDRETRYVLVCYSPLIVSLASSVILEWWVAVLSNVLMLSGAIFYMALDSHLKLPQFEQHEKPANLRVPYVI